MKGHWRVRSGSVELRVYAGRDPLTGKKLYPTKTIPMCGQREADTALAAFVTEVVTTGVAAAGTFGELADAYYALRKEELVPAGRVFMRSTIDVKLAALRPMKLSVLDARTSTALIDKLYAALRERGGDCTLEERCQPRPCKGRCNHGLKDCPVPRPGLCAHGGALSRASVARIHNVLRAVLEQGVVWGYLTRNAAEHASPGEADDAEEVELPEPSDVTRLLEAAAAMSEDFLVYVILSAVTGRRRGAIHGLWWEDVNLQYEAVPVFDAATGEEVDRWAGQIHFRHVVSLGENGPERVPIGRGRNNKKKAAKGKLWIDPMMTAVLAAHRLRCEDRARLAGVELSEDSYLFSRDALGQVPWRPDSTSRKFKHLCGVTGVDAWLHLFRNVVITRLFAGGFAAPDVGDYVGQGDGGRTALEVYAKSLRANGREAGAMLARLFIAEPTSAAPLDPEPGGAVIIPLRPRAS